MKSFEQAMLRDEFEDDDDFDQDSYCVKIGKWIPGGCEEEICEDVGKCPYLTETNLNKYN